MKKLLSGFALSLCVTAPALAADLPARMPVKAPPPVIAAVYNWTGFYIGGHVGYASGRSRTDALPPDALDCGGAPPCESVSHSVRGAFGGAHAGYNWQVNTIVFGVEVEGGYIGAKGTAFSPTTPDHFYSTKYGAYGAFTGRLGIAADRVLFYGKGGVVVAHIKNEAFDDFPTPDPEHLGRKSGARLGWTAGGGIEYAFNSNWTARAEYLYMRFKRETVFDIGDGGVDPSPYNFHNHLHTGRFGLTYKFGGPVVARY